MVRASTAFEFNIKKAERSIIVFVIASFVFVTLVVYFNNDIDEGADENRYVLFVFIFAYFVYLGVLLWRIYNANFKNKPIITIKDDVLIFPTFHLGKRKILLTEVSTIENLFPKSNHETLILGLSGKGRSIIDKNLFIKSSDFYEFKKILQETVERYSSMERRGSIDKFSNFQKGIFTFTTTAIVILCIFAFFLANSFSLSMSENSDFLLMGAGTADFLENKEYYRLFSSTFIHLGPLHLLLNLVVLGIIGELLERTITSLRFANIFFLSSLSAYLFFALFSNFEIGAGASGGIFGLWGAYFALKLRYEKYLPGSVNAIPLNRLAWLLLAEFLAEIFLLDSVGVEVHLGGFLTGFIYLYFIPLGSKLEIVDQPTFYEKGLFATLISSYSIGLSYFLLLYYGLI